MDDIFCKIHENNKIEYICLNKICNNRILCVKCANFNHNINHKIVETSLLEGKTIIEFLIENNNPNENINLEFSNIFEKEISSILPNIKKTIEESINSFQNHFSWFKSNYFNSKQVSFIEITNFFDKIEANIYNEKKIENINFYANKAIETFFELKNNDKNNEVWLKKLKLFSDVCCTYSKILQKFFENDFISKNIKFYFFLDKF